MVWNGSGNLVSGTKTAVKRAPMMQSAPYNQNVPENFSGDSTWIRKDESQIQDYSEVEVVPLETFLTRSMKVFETMKPAMKAKQIIIEFAIDRT